MQNAIRYPQLLSQLLCRVVLARLHQRQADEQWLMPTFEQPAHVATAAGKHAMSDARRTRGLEWLPWLPIA